MGLKNALSFCYSLKMVEDPVVLALRTAIASADATELRTALAEHLLKLGRATEALAELEAALEKDPGDASVLQLLVTGAEAAGDRAKAEAYRLVLKHTNASSPARKPTPPAVAAPPQEEGRVRATHAGALRLVASDGEVVSDIEAECPGLRLSDVGGLEAVKLRLEKSFLLPLRRPDLYQRFGKSISGGLLLYGPPGCGKTFVARALAGELGARFLSIGLSDVFDMWLGESERKLHELFENARRLAPTLIFFDEVDAIGQRRTQLKHSAGRNIVNQLLSELDGMGGANNNIFVLGATNHPWDIDPALRRPGRFDRMIFVPPPDDESRAAVLKLKLVQRPAHADLNLSAVVHATAGFSGADLQAVVDEATEIAIERTLASGGSDAAIDSEMLLAAAKNTQPSVRPWLETARNYAIYANEGGVYDDLLDYLKSARLL